MVLGGSFSAHAADEIITVDKILSNPSAFHRHVVVLKGALKLVGELEGSTLGNPSCGPIFKLEDDTGDILVMYIIRCDAAEIDRVTAIAGQRAIIHATIEAATVISTADGIEYKTRAMATKIQRDEQ